MIFLPEQIRPYLNMVEDLLSPFCNDFSKPIVIQATKQLCADCKQYNFIKDKRPIDPDNEYYFALFDDRNRSYHFYRSWASIYILYSMRPRGMELTPSDNVIFIKKALKDFLFNYLEKTSKDKEICPQCFLDGFNIDLIKREVDIFYY